MRATEKHECPTKSPLPPVIVDKNVLQPEGNLECTFQPGVPAGTRSAGFQVKPLRRRYSRDRGHPAASPVQRQPAGKVPGAE